MYLLDFINVSLLTYLDEIQLNEVTKRIIRYFNCKAPKICNHLMCKVSDMQFHYACHAKCVMCENIDICLNTRYVIICTYEYKRYGIS